MEFLNPLPKTGTIAFAEICRQLKVTDVDQRGRILEFVRQNKARIRPTPDDEWMSDELVSYYLDSVIRTDREVEMAYTPFEAAAALVSLFNWLLSHEPDGRQRAAKIAHRLADLFRKSSPEIQNRIETGFLEHALETPIARPIFAFWSQDPILADSHSAALAWGLAHSIEKVA
ncbi:MAG: hypothetical protein V4719_04910 [Planctomycetota bacterium]